MSARETADLESLVMRCPSLADGVLIKGEQRDDGYYATFDFIETRVTHVGNSRPAAPTSRPASAIGKLTAA